MSAHEKITYVELPASDFEKVKTFFTQVFAWKFTDYGTEYTAFTYSGIDGGFYKSPLSSLTNQGGALVVLFSENIQFYAFNYKSLRILKIDKNVCFFVLSVTIETLFFLNLLICIDNN